MAEKFSLQKTGGLRAAKKSAKGKRSQRRKPAYLQEVEFAPCGVEIKKGTRDTHFETCSAKSCKKARSESFEKAA